MAGRIRWSLIAVSVLLLAGVVRPVDGCTGIRLTAADGTVVHARTLEFVFDMDSSVIVVPRGTVRTGTTPDGKPGLKWTTKYASVGANGAGLPIMLDGLNEKGLASGLFYFPNAAGYMAYEAGDAGKTLAPWELGSWILENFATTEEVKQKVEEVVVPTVVFKDWGFSPGVHYIVVDASGASIVIEYIDGKLNVYDNPLGVLTNSPAFDWHMTNLRNYVNLSDEGLQPVHLGDVKLVPFGQGTGMLGLPGDFTPPSRFVRAAVFSQSALPVSTGREVVLQAFHLLNNFDIPKGAARDGKPDANGNVAADYTMWTSVCDLKEKQFYFRTFDNSQIRSVDLNKMDLDGKSVTTISMKGGEVIKPLTPGK